MRRCTRRCFGGGCAAAAAAGVGGLLANSARKAAATAKAEKAFEPAYLKLHRGGELKKRGQELWDSMKECHLCPRGDSESKYDRLAGEEGHCKATSDLIIASYNPHFGEERPLVGTHGSGTIFFSHCSLRCVFCINWEISHKGEGKKRSIAELAGMMLSLQRRGCHNINLVTPTHYSAHILLALDMAASKGLRLPIVYNTCGWERIQILEKLDGVVDIYLPDFKYWDEAMATKYSGEAESYPEVCQVALEEMHRQVGAAKPDADGLMRRGLMIRHLVMPNGVSGSEKIMAWIGDTLPKDTCVNIMSQYRPCHKARDYPEIARPITRNEYRSAVAAARKAGLTNLNIQGKHIL